MRSAPTLKIRITDEVKVWDFTAPGAVKQPQPSPYFQPEFTFAMSETGGEGGAGHPRGPTITIDMQSLMDAFE